MVYSSTTKKKEENTLNDWNRIRTHNYLARKLTLNHLAELVWLNGWVLVYKLSGCWFESRCSHLNFRYRASFKQGVTWTFRELLSVDLL